MTANILLNSSALLLSKFFVFASAAAGGVIIFLGLWLEWKSDKELYSDLDHFKASKLSAKRGEKLVMVGVSVEIVIAIWSANDALQTKQMVINADWRNQRITEISAIVTFTVKEDSFSENPLWGDPKRIATIFLCETNLVIGNHFEGFSQLELLDADHGDRAGDEKQPQYILHFHRSFDGDFFISSLSERTNTVAWALENIRFLDIETKFLPHDTEIIGGSAVLTINSSQQIKFNIPRQKDLSLNSGKIGWGYQVIASKSQNVP